MGAKKGAATAVAIATETVSIKPPNMQTIQLQLEGTAPLCINKFSTKAMEVLTGTQAGGSQSRSKKNREPKDFDALCEGAKHVSEEGWCGVHAAAFRAAMVSACRLVNIKMTLAKLSIFIMADGYDKEDGTPLVRIYGEPEKWVAPVRNQTGVIDLRSRPLWRKWSAKVRIRYDGDLYTAADIANLLQRVGDQVGIGEGRPDSKQSCGLGYGLFRLA